MKIQYISCHAILEYDEVKLLTELGHDVDSNGAYRDPRGAYTLPRPGIEGAKFDQAFCDRTAIFPKTNLPKELIDPYDALIFMSGESEQPLLQNWPNIKHKRVIWRTIGQSTPATERAIAPLIKEGLQVIRYSPKERNISGYAGDDAMIRFYKDPDEFKEWTGVDKRPINFSQSLRGRGRSCHYDEILGSMMGFDGAKVYGTGNADLGMFNGGEVPYWHLKELMQHCRVFVYGGTWPASYTLSFIEAMMTGIPIVAIGKNLMYSPGFEQFDFYEVPEIMQLAGLQTFDDIGAMRNMVQQYLERPELAQEASKKQRQTAIELFGKAGIAKQWADFLG